MTQVIFSFISLCFHWIQKFYINSLLKHFFLLGFISLFFTSTIQLNAKTVRIGIYDNPPKIEKDEKGNPSGIFIDIIEYIAKSEKWTLDFVYGTWDEGLKALENGKIDLMLDVAISEKRKQKFDFNQIAVLSSWLQIFCNEGENISSIAELNGKTIAVLEGSIQHQMCIEIQKKFGISFKIEVLSDYDETIKFVKSGKADAVLAGSFYGFSKKKDAKLVSTPVILYPTALHFAVKKGKNQDLLILIDKYMSQMINNSRSVYYKSLNRWLDETPRMFIPGFIIWLIIITSLILMLFFILSIILRYQVKKRTYELSEANNELMTALHNLKIAREEAIKKEHLHVLGQLTSGIAHDFNNLLMPILTNAEIMLSDTYNLNDTEKIKQHLKMIYSAANHGAEIVKRMQNFYSSVSHNEEKSLIDLNEVIIEVLELTSVRLNHILKNGNKISVIQNLSYDLKIKAKKSDIHEMLLNLILNAADAMPNGGLLEISTVKNNESVVLSVKDNGLGMSDEVKEKCLLPFFTTKGEKGTGIGLAMVSKIIEEHNGNLAIESSYENGTSFIITFPL